MLTAEQIEQHRRLQASMEMQGNVAWAAADRYFSVMEDHFDRREPIDAGTPAGQELLQVAMALMFGELSLRRGRGSLQVLEDEFLRQQVEKN
jgi:hypothetical protein